MLSRKSRDDSDILWETAEYFCFCTPMWECVYPDEFYESTPMRYRVMEWKNERKMRRLERIETRNREKARQKERRRSISRERQRSASRERRRTSSKEHRSNLSFSAWLEIRNEWILNRGDEVDATRCKIPVTLQPMVPRWGLFCEPRT